MNEKELRKLINEVTAEIIAEADADDDGIDAAGLPLDGDDDDAEDYPQSTHFSNDTGDDAFMAWSTAAASSMKDEKITQAKDIPWFTDTFGNAELSPYDEYKKGTTPEEYASLIDRHQSVGKDKLSYDDWVQRVLAASSKMTDANDIEDGFDPDTGEQIKPDDAWLKGADPTIYAQSVDELAPGDEGHDAEYYERGFFAESKEFTFDKFMKDVNSREDKIEQRKKELTENEGDTNARLKQKRYQEDWRNSTRLKGNK
jgi:hypothetical protein